MGKDSYRLVYIDSTYHPVAVSVAAFHEIKAIVEANKLCIGCYQPYTEERPQVAENVCLMCFVAKRTEDPTRPVFVGEEPSEYAERYGYKIYLFKDRQGYLYRVTSQEEFNKRHSRDILATLQHYGYQVPVSYTMKGGSVVDLQTHSWYSIIGDFQNSPVVIATYIENYGNRISTAFLLYRDSEPLEVSKRRNPVRLWYQESKAAIEATYTPHKGYVIGLDIDGEPHTAYQLHDSHMYPGIVARAVQAYHRENSTKLALEAK